MVRKKVVELFKRLTPSLKSFSEFLLSPLKTFPSSPKEIIKSWDPSDRFLPNSILYLRALTSFSLPKNLASTKSGFEVFSAIAKNVLAFATSLLA